MALTHFAIFTHKKPYVITLHGFPKIEASGGLPIDPRDNLYQAHLDQLTVTRARI